MADRAHRIRITRELRDAYDIHIASNPTDDQQLQFIRAHNQQYTQAQVFQIFRILNNREHPSIIQNRLIFQEIENLFLPEVQAQQQIPPHQQPQVNMAAANNANAWTDDPFRGNIQPGTTEGQKLYLKAIAKIDDDDKYEINIENAQKFLDDMSQDANNFGWGRLVRHVQVSDTDFKDLFKDHKDITAEHIKKQAYKTWGNHVADFATAVPEGYDLQDIDPANNQAHQDIFFRRVRSRMIAKRIMNYLKSSDLEVLRNKQKLYTWTGNGIVEHDGPNILWILLQTCNTSTRVGVAELKEDLRKATSSKFKHDVRALTDYMSSKLRKIREKGQRHDDFHHDLFKALETVPNTDFAAHVREEKRRWEIGGEKSADQLILEIVTIYNNAVASNTWDNKDPKDAKIMALTTEMQELKEMHRNLMAFSSTAGQTSQSKTQSKGGGSRINIDAWRMTKTTPMVEKDGKTWYWCPHHVYEDKYNGLYVTHKPEDHEDWVKRKQSYKDRMTKKKTSDVPKDDDADDSSGKKLTLTDTLKTALMTKCDITGAQADALIKEAESEADF